MTIAYLFGNIFTELSYWMLKVQCCDQRPVVSGKGLTYGPNGQNRLYDSLYIHRGTRKKSKWAITPQAECRVFCTADNKNWLDNPRQCYWSVQGNCEVIGELEERLAKFPVPSNGTDPWHGYPVFASVSAPHDCPSQEFIQKWIDDGVVSKTNAKRVLGYVL